MKLAHEYTKEEFLALPDNSFIGDQHGNRYPALSFKNVMGDCKVLSYERAKAHSDSVYLAVNSAQIEVSPLVMKDYPNE